MVASLSEFSQCSDTIHRQMVQLLMKALIQRIPSLNWNPVIRNMFPDAVWGSLENVDDQYVNVLPNVTEQDVYDLQNDLLIAVAKLMGPSGNLLGDYNEKDGLFLISNPSLGVTRERTWFELSLEKFFKRVGTDFQQALYPLNILYLEVISGGGA